MENETIISHSVELDALIKDIDYDVIIALCSKHNAHITEFVQYKPMTIGISSRDGNPYYYAWYDKAPEEVIEELKNFCDEHKKQNLLISYCQNLTKSCGLEFKTRGNWIQIHIDEDVMITIRCDVRDPRDSRDFVYGMTAWAELPPKDHYDRLYSTGHLFKTIDLYDHNVDLNIFKDLLNTIFLYLIDHIDRTTTQMKSEVDTLEHQKELIKEKSKLVNDGKAALDV